MLAYLARFSVYQAHNESIILYIHNSEIVDVNQISHPQRLLRNVVIQHDVARHGVSKRRRRDFREIFRIVLGESTDVSIAT